MKKRLNTAEICVASAPYILCTGGVGSCVVICLWDSVSKLGAMAHIPWAKDESAGKEVMRNPALSPDTAVTSMLQRLSHFGVQTHNLVVKLTGAGNMFAGLDAGPMVSMVEEILEGALGALKMHKLDVRGKCMGGKLSRSVFFNLENGAVEIQFSNGTKKLI